MTVASNHGQEHGLLLLSACGSMQSKLGQTSIEKNVEGTKLAERDGDGVVHQMCRGPAGSLLKGMVMAWSTRYHGPCMPTYFTLTSHLLHCTYFRKCSECGEAMTPSNLLYIDIQAAKLFVQAPSRGRKVIELDDGGERAGPTALSSARRNHLLPPTCHQLRSRLLSTKSCSASSSSPPSPFSGS
eukprot:1160550-Pelagomonas_calceolata.AAC.1